MALTEVQALELQLAAAREREAKAKQPTTLAEKIAAGEADVNRLENEKNRIATLVSKLTNEVNLANKQLNGESAFFGDTNSLRNDLARANAELDLAGKNFQSVDAELSKAHYRLGSLRSEAAKNPHYADAIAQHRELATTTLNLITAMWSAFSEAYSLSRELSAIPNKEQALIDTLNETLRQKGLPLLNCAIGSPAMSCIPEFVDVLNQWRFEYMKTIAPISRLVKG